MPTYDRGLDRPRYLDGKLPYENRYPGIDVERRIQEDGDSRCNVIQVDNLPLTKSVETNYGTYEGESLRVFLYFFPSFSYFFPSSPPRATSIAGFSLFLFYLFISVFNYFIHCFPYSPCSTLVLYRGKATQEALGLSSDSTAVNGAWRGVSSPPFMQRMN